MKLTSLTIFLVLGGASAYLALLYFIDRQLRGRGRVIFRYAAVAGTVGLFFLAMSRLIDDHARAVDMTKAVIAITAAGCVFYESARAGAHRPIAERWKKAVGVILGVAAIVAYFNGFKIGAPRFYHGHDQFHYYMGAKYFDELGYSGLYKCTAIAQDELGSAATIQLDGRTLRLDMKKEVRHPDKKIRNLGGDNLLIPIADILDHPEQCRDLFTPARWEIFKEDVRFFRFTSDKSYWEGMQKDHGYNPPPVWTIAGKIFGELHPASVRYLQFLGSLDLFYLAGMFVALWWAFGWRVSMVGAIFWGCQSSAPFYWTGGAFLRQDWLFYLVLSACLIRKRWFKLAGAAMVYAGLLRVFPGLAVIGWLTTAAIYLVRHKRMHRTHVQVLIGGVLGAIVLVGLSLQIAGRDSYKQFYEHTIKVHDQTPLTNHMGLRVLVAQKTPVEIPQIGVGVGTQSGRMKYTKDVKLADPFQLWKDMRNERYRKVRYAAYAIIALSFLGFVYVLRRVKSLWISQCLGQIWIILLSQLTCYYYSFMILAAPLTKVKRGIEAPLFGLAALSQFVWMIFYWNDDKYWALTAISLIFCYGLLCAFAGNITRFFQRKE